MIVKLKEFDIELNGSFKFIMIGIEYIQIFIQNLMLALIKY